MNFWFYTTRIFFVAFAIGKTVRAQQPRRLQQRKVNPGKTTCDLESLQLQEIIGTPPIPESLHSFCDVDEDPSKAICDYSEQQNDDYVAKCNKAGGFMFSYSFDACPPADNNNKKFDGLKRIQVINFQECISNVCNEEEYPLYYGEDILSYSNFNCPKEEELDRFVLRENTQEKGDEDPILTKTCKWLQNQSERKQKRICFSNKSQLYIEGNLPASQVCPKTCKPQMKNGLCVEENAAAKFIAKMRNGAEKVRNCEWLQQKSSVLQEIVCFASPIVKNSKYGRAFEVCTKTCGTCEE